MLLELAALVQSALMTPTETLEKRITSIDLSSCSFEKPCKGDAEGVSYKIIGKHEADFSAGEKWALWIPVDAFSDQKTCVLKTRKSQDGRHVPELSMILYGNSAAFSIYHYKYDNYPGSDELFRVDKNLTIDKIENKPMPPVIARQLIQQMRAGNSLLIAFERWPEQYRESSTINLKGFTAIHRAAIYMCNNYN